MRTIFLEYWQLFSILVTASLALGYWLRMQFDYRRKNFCTQVNFSLNYLDRGTLVFPTLLETDLHSLMLDNEALAKIVLRAARRTSEGSPFLEITRESDRWMVYNELENAITPMFGSGYFAADLGVPVKTAEYFFALTCEKGADIPLRKLRVMLVSRDTLSKIAELNETGRIKFKNALHRPRLALLLAMRAHLMKDPQAYPRIDVAVPLLQPEGAEEIQHADAALKQLKGIK